MEVKGFTWFFSPNMTSTASNPADCLLAVRKIQQDSSSPTLPSLNWYPAGPYYDRYAIHMLHAFRS